MRHKFLFTLILMLSGGVFFDAAAQDAPAVPKAISGGVLNGKAITLTKPAYPAAAQAVRASGAVNVQVTIDENGDVISASAVSGHPLLRQAAEQATQTSKFAPTTLQGQPVKVTGVIVYNFVASQNLPNNEEKLMVMGLTTFLTVADFIPSEEWDVLKKEELAETARIAAELEPLTAITKQTSKEKRAEIIKTVMKSLENKLSGDDAWQFRFGKEFGVLLLEIRGEGETADRVFNETAVKTRLAAIRDSLADAPADFPPDVLDKFREIVKFADLSNLNSEANKYRFIALLSETLETISPDFTEN